jgi:hypothetical protein
MGIPSPDPAKCALCAYFFSGYLKKNPNDAENFPPDQFPDGFIRYEALFHDALFHLKMTKEDLRARQEFNFDSGDANNLESAIGLLRTAIHLGQAKFSQVTLIKSKQKWPEAGRGDANSGIRLASVVRWPELACVSRCPSTALTLASWDWARTDSRDLERLLGAAVWMVRARCSGADAR